MHCSRFFVESDRVESDCKWRMYLRAPAEIEIRAGDPLFIRCGPNSTSDEAVVVLEEQLSISTREN